MPNAKNQSVLLSSRLLRGCRDAAIDNARELLYEANLLATHNHRARAYFAAIVAIEEVGRAVQAFDALGRNLRDRAISQRVLLNFDDYTRRIAAAFFPLMLFVPERRDEVTACVDTMLEGRHGRERVIHTAFDMDADPPGPRVVTPNSFITKALADKWMEMAHAVYVQAEAYVYSPSKLRTKEEDDLFAMKPSAMLAMTHNPDFWEYYIACMKTGDAAFEDAVAEYNRKYLARNLKFRDESGLACDDN